MSGIVAGRVSHWADALDVPVSEIVKRAEIRHPAPPLIFLPFPDKSRPGEGCLAYCREDAEALAARFGRVLDI